MPKILAKGVGYQILYKERGEDSEKIAPSGLSVLSRLDLPVPGIIAVADSGKRIRILSKKYYLVCQGKLEEDEGVLEDLLFHDSRSTRTFPVKRMRKGVKEARLTYKVLSYKYDVTDWLRSISVNNEPHIVSALDQYIDFLENKFHTTSLDIDMNNEIKDFLLKELKVDNSTLEEQLSALDSQYNKTQELLSSIDSLKIELRKELSHKMMREWQRQIEKLLCIKLSQDDHSFGVQLNNKVWLGVWDGYDSANHLPYWGFQYTTYKKDDNPELYKCVETLITGAGINKFQADNKEFIAWYTTQKGVERFTSLYHAAKEKGLLP